MKGTIYIHIGMPKAGSSAVQAFLTLNHKTLKKRGYLFPNPPTFNQSFQTSSGNMFMLLNLFSNNEISKIKGIIKSIFTEKNLILSTEGFYYIIRLYPKRFFEVFRNYDYKIICYVRRQDNLISSYYKQSVKNHNVKSRSIIPKLIEEVDFCKTLLNTLAYTDFSRIIVRPYEKQQFYGGNICSDFLNCIGLELDDDFVLPDNVVNPSFSYDIFEFRRILNILGVEGNIKEKYLINTLLAKYTVNKDNGYPFTDNNIFSPKERIKIINNYKKENEKIARVFLNRQDGKLFFDKVPKVDDPWKPHEDLSFEIAVDICRYMLRNKYKENVDKELIEIIVKGTVNKILGKT